MDSDLNHTPSDPDRDVRQRIRRAQELAKESKFAEAVAEYDFIIEHGVDLTPDIFADRGCYKSNCGDFEGCIADSTHALALCSDPASPLHIRAAATSLYNRAAAQKNLGRDEEALIDFDALLKIKPTHLLGLYYRAFTYGNLGMWERAILAWEPYMERVPEDWWPRLYRGIAFTELGMKAEAITEYQKGTELNPRFKAFYFRRWTLYRELKEPELAQKDFEAGNAIIHEPMNPFEEISKLEQIEVWRKRRISEASSADGKCNSP